MIWHNNVAHVDSQDHEHAKRRQEIDKVNALGDRR